MRDKPAISIIIPTHNRRRLLQETVASVFAQTFRNWELIVIDDASSDDTWEWLRGLQNAQVRIFHFEEHRERTQARNFGLEAARGEFVLFLDDDDLLPASALQMHWDALSQYPETFGSVGSFIMFDENGGRQAVRYGRRRQAHDLWPDLLFGHIPVSGQSLFRTQAMTEINGWDTDYNICEDHVLWLKLSQLGRIVLLPDVVLHYRLHRGQWRPRKLWQLMTKIRKRALKKLNAAQRMQAEKILQAREHFRSGENHYARGETVKALQAYCKTAWLLPGVLLSPVTRMMLVAPMLKCLLGGRPVIERVLGRKPLEFSRLHVAEDEGKPQEGTTSSGLIHFSS
ncbi:glycosyltransferase [candidate division KSB1 bacterium]|nr:glycosyltransferase [candidate division KSB1 bacterium]